MRLIDADLLEPDSDWDEYEDWFTACSMGQIKDSETVKAIPIERLEQIRAEIQELTKCPYKECVGEDDCPFQDCMIHGQHVIGIIDKAIKEQNE